MKKLMRLGALLSCLPLSGCFTCMSSWCLGEDAYQKLMHPKPYLHYWDKPGMTAESRREDSASCGGGSSDNTGFSQNKIKAARRPDETENATYARLFHDWERCMIKQGYRFTGKCYDNEIGRASPACAGRVLQPLKP